MRSKLMQSFENDSIFIEQSRKPTLTDSERENKQLAIENIYNKSGLILNNQEQASDQITDAFGELDNLRTLQRTLNDNGPVLNELSLELLQQNTNNIYKRLGVKTIRLATESFKPEDRTQYAVESVLEVIGRTITAIWEAIVRMVKRAKDFFASLFGFNKKTEEKIQDISKQADVIISEKFEKTTTVFEVVSDEEIKAQKAKHNSRSSKDTIIDVEANKVSVSKDGVTNEEETYRPPSREKSDDVKKSERESIENQEREDDLREKQTKERAEAKARRNALLNISIASILFDASAGPTSTFSFISRMGGISDLLSGMSDFVKEVQKALDLFEPLLSESNPDELVKKLDKISLKKGFYPEWFSINEKAKNNDGLIEVIPHTPLVYSLKVSITCPAESYTGHKSLKQLKHFKFNVDASDYLSFSDDTNSTIYRNAKVPVLDANEVKDLTSINLKIIMKNDAICEEINSKETSLTSKMPKRLNNSLSSDKYSKESSEVYLDLLKTVEALAKFLNLDLIKFIHAVSKINSISLKYAQASLHVYVQPE